MTEIRINSRPCPNCGHRNVTVARACEQCGKGSGMDKNLRLMLIGAAVLSIVAFGGLYAIDAFTPSPDTTIAPVFSPTPTPDVKANPKGSGSKEIYTDNQLKPKTPTQKVAQFTMPESQDYRRVTMGAERIKSAFQVRVSSKPIPLNEHPEIAQLAQTLEAYDQTGKKVYILSFAGAKGSTFLAEKRAQFVQQVLEEKYNISIPVSVEAFGPAPSDPTADFYLEAWVK